MHGEFFCSVVTPLAADYFWTNGILKIGPSLMKAMEQWSSEGFNDVQANYTPDASALVLDDLKAHNSVVGAAAEDRLYSWRDYASGEQLV